MNSGASWPGLAITLTPSGRLLEPRPNGSEYQLTDAGRDFACEIDICPKDPGFEVDHYVRTDARTMTRV